MALPVVITGNFLGLFQKKKTWGGGGRDGTPYSNMWVVGYDIFEIPWVVVERINSIMWVVVLTQIEFYR